MIGPHKECMTQLPGTARPHLHIVGAPKTAVASVPKPFVVPMSELLTPEFIFRHTRFATAEDMIRASGYRIESAADFDAVANDGWNDFIRAESRYSSWKAMTRVASGEWMWRRLGYAVDA